MNDVVASNVQTIQQCVRRAREEYAADPNGLRTNFTRQDAALLTIVRACETAIDLANHVIRARQLGNPTSSADGFRLLQAAGIIEPRLAERLTRMVGFRNTVIHQDTAVDVAIVEVVIVRDLDDVLAFADVVRALV